MGTSTVGGHAVNGRGAGGAVAAMGVSGSGTAHRWWSGVGGEGQSGRVRLKFFQRRGALAPLYVERSSQMTGGVRP